MRLVGGVGSGHDMDDHRVSGCIHTHAHCRHGNMKTGGGSMGPQMAQTQMQRQQQDAQFTLTEWIQRMLGRGKSILKGIWGTNETISAGPAGDKTGSAQTMAQVGDTGAAAGHSMAAHSTAAHSAETVGNPYFKEISEKNAAAHMTPFRKIRSKIVAGAEKLAGKLPGKAFQFQTKNSFHAKPQQHSRENLRKRSRYKKDELEIDCVLTDESYLMDSYDRKGEYTQLTTKK